jgi:type II secretory pathway pseudopilin PulG
MRNRSKFASQSGYVLLGVMLLITLMLIALTVAVPRVAQQVKREKEEELIHRGQEYCTAIGKFFKANNGLYPASLDQLENTNNKRFLRRRYKDPMTGKDDWRLIHVGESQLNLTPTGNPSLPGGSNQSGTNPNNTGSSLQSGGSSNQTGLSSGNSGQSGLGPDSSPPNNTSGSNGLVPVQNLASAPAGQQVGGGQIIGIASSNKAESIKELRGKNHYNEWEFIYDIRFAAAGGGCIVNAPVSGTGPAGTPGTPPPGSAPPGAPAPQ